MFFLHKEKLHENPSSSICAVPFKINSSVFGNIFLKKFFDYRSPLFIGLVKVRWKPSYIGKVWSKVLTSCRSTKIRELIPSVRALRPVSCLQRHLLAFVLTQMKCKRKCKMEHHQTFLNQLLHDYNVSTFLVKPQVSSLWFHSSSVNEWTGWTISQMGMVLNN